MRKKDKAVSADTASVKKNRKKKILAVTAALLLVAAGAVLYDVVGPGFINHLVTFDCSGGEEIDAVRVKLGRKIELPEPVRQDYTFTGWTLAGEEVTSPFGPDEDVTLTAEWIGNEYTVSFDLAGGTSEIPVAVTLRTGDALTLPSAAPVREGYVFQGWYDAEGTQVTSGTVLPWGNTVLTAGWDYEYYDLTFDTDGAGSADTVSYHIDDALSLPSVSRKGYHLLGWFDQEENEYKNGDVLPVGGLALKASWERNTFKVSFDSNGGSSVSAVSVNEGDPFKYPQAPWRDGYVFAGWTDKDGNDVADGTILSGPLTLYAKWNVQPDEYTTNGYKITKRNGITYIGGVIIANKTYPLPSTYAPGGLTSDCMSAFNSMKEAAAADGISLSIVSGYRSYSTQESIYWRYVNNRGMEKADTFSARPGHSEHQTGLAMDLNSLDDNFGETAEGKWLAEHCHEYGFIIRYPKNKQSITGYKYEPWHVRYLGVELATKVYESGLCLEEYFGITSQYQIASAYDQFGRN